MECDIVEINVSQDQRNNGRSNYDFNEKNKSVLVTSSRLVVPINWIYACGGKIEVMCIIIKSIHLFISAYNGNNLICKRL